MNTSKGNRLSQQAAADCIDFSGGAEERQSLAEVQLKTATAAYNKITSGGFAYLADEVGTGKTYAALGVIALMRLHNPGLKVLYITPKRNIQEKWIKEYRNFVRYNYRNCDEIVKTRDGEPAPPFIMNENLEDFARSLSQGYYSDYFLRMSSFSFGLGGDDTGWNKKGRKLLKMVGGCSIGPYSNDGCPVDERKDKFKEWYAVNINRVMPVFDLVVIDEAHNFKKGVDSSSRNRLLTRCLGTPMDTSYYTEATTLKVKNALFLSATPYDQDFHDLTNQLHIVNKKGMLDLGGNKTVDECKCEIRNVLLRSLGCMDVNGISMTRNMYRREWRRGGIEDISGELDTGSDLEKLIVGLTQKKVADVLNTEKFGNRFQMGMLASFESFMETAGINSSETRFDGGEQTDKDSEKEGADAGIINGMVTDFKQRFDSYLPHPKMDSIVKQFRKNLETGEKVLIFARRVKTVPELRNKLSEEYDSVMIRRMRAELNGYEVDFDAIEKAYTNARSRYRITGDELVANGEEDGAGQENADFDDNMELKKISKEAAVPYNFFRWFFVKESQKYYYPSRLKKGLLSSTQSFATMLQENFVQLLTGNDDVWAGLCEAVNLPPTATTEKLNRFAAYFYRTAGHRLKSKVKPHLYVYHSVQKAGLCLLREYAHNPEIKEAARCILNLNYDIGEPPSIPEGSYDKLPDVNRYLGLLTFFSELRKYDPLCRELYCHREILRAGAPGVLADRIKKMLVLKELLGTTLRLGHSVVDLYLAHINARKGFAPDGSLNAASVRTGTIQGLVRRLEQQRQAETENIFSSYYELSSIRGNLDLLIRTNFPELEERKVEEYSRYFSHILKEQSPVEGLWGGINKRSIQQFRMPGYPIILVATDVLQEGEDLHTFCSHVIHYGISWTPTSIEQKTGRIDRVASLTERRIAGKTGISGDDYMQVYFPYLQDTVEVYQVRRLFRRMNRFISQLHDFGTPMKMTGDSHIAVSEEVLDRSGVEPQYVERLYSPFEVESNDLEGSLSISFTDIKVNLEQQEQHFRKLCEESSRRLGWVITAKGTNSVKGNCNISTSKVKVLPFELRLRTAKRNEMPIVECSAEIGGAVSRGQFGKMFRNELLKVDFPSQVQVRLNQSGDKYRLRTQTELLFGTNETQVEEIDDMILRVVNDGIALQIKAENTDWNGYQLLQYTEDYPEEFKFPAKNRLKNVLPKIKAYGIDNVKILNWSNRKARLYLTLGGRKQYVRLEKNGQYIYFISQAANKRLLRERTIDELVTFCWGRNALTDLVDFYFSAKGDLHGRILQLGATMQDEEMAYYIACLAIEVDRLEYLIEKKDKY